MLLVVFAMVAVHTLVWRPLDRVFDIVVDFVLSGFLMNRSNV